jgi:cob(I)alamin adenosyltransferase
MSITINRVYTRSGDTGETSLVDGSRVSKDCLRCESYGTIDELNAVLGIAKEHAKIESKSLIFDILEYLQQELFDIGAELATPSGYTYPKMWVTAEKHVNHLEKLCDYLNKDLPPLNSFILPGGSFLSAFLHQARTICRRSERVIVSLNKVENLNNYTVIYVNRLSDLLFVMSRYALKDDSAKVPLWVQEESRLSPLDLLTAES